MRTRLTIVCLLTGLLLTHATFSQRKPAEGYVVTSQGDTLRGFIDNKDWDVSPETVLFCAEENGTFLPHSVTNTAAFFLKESNRLYLSRRVTLQQVENKLYYERLSVSTQQAHVFVQVLLAGPAASLYRMTDQNRKTMYLLEKNQQVIELVNSPHRIQRGSTVYEQPGDLYKQQLKTYCLDAASFRDDDLPGYSEEALKAYLRKYNACFVGSTTTYEAPRQKAQLDVGAQVGIQLNPIGQVAGISPTLSPSLGAVMRLSLPRNHYNRFWRLSYRVTMDVKRIRRSGGQEAVERNTLKSIAIGGGTYFGSGNLRPYIFFGYDLTRLKKEEAFGGLILGGGISYKRALDLELDGLRLRTILNRETPGPALRLLVYFPSSLR